MITITTSDIFQYQIPAIVYSLKKRKKKIVKSKLLPKTEAPVPAKEKPSVFFPNENPPPDPKSAKLERFFAAADAPKSIPLLRFSGLVTVPPKILVVVDSFGFELPPKKIS